MSVKDKITQEYIMETFINMLSTHLDHDKDKVFLYLSLATSYYLKDMAKDEEKKTHWLYVIRKILNLLEKGELDFYDVTPWNYM